MKNINVIRDLSCAISNPYKAHECDESVYNSHYEMIDVIKKLNLSYVSIEVNPSTCRLYVRYNPPACVSSVKSKRRTGRTTGRILMALYRVLNGDGKRIEFLDHDKMSVTAAKHNIKKIKNIMDLLSIDAKIFMDDNKIFIQKDKNNFQYLLRIKKSNQDEKFVRMQEGSSDKVLRIVKDLMDKNDFSLVKISPNKKIKEKNDKNNA